MQCVISFQLSNLAHAQGCKTITTSPLMVATKIASSNAQPGTGVEDGWHSPTDTLVIDHHKVVKGNGS